MRKAHQKYGTNDRGENIYESTSVPCQAPEARAIPASGEARRTPDPATRGPEARSIQASIPKVAFFTFDPILLQEYAQLILKSLLRVMRLLLVDVMNQRIQIGRPYRKRTIPALPRKLCQFGRLTLQPFRRGRFDLRNQVRNIRRAVQSNGEMDVIRNTANAKALALIVADNRCQISVEIGSHNIIENGSTVLRAEDNMDKKKAQRSCHGENYRSDLRPSGPKRNRTWGVAPRWYIVSPPALALAVLPMILSSCKSSQSNDPTALRPGAMVDPPIKYPARPTTPPPPFKIFHQTDNSITLVTDEHATDDQIKAIIWQLRDAAHAHTFAALRRRLPRLRRLHPRQLREQGPRRRSPSERRRPRDPSLEPRLTVHRTIALF